MKKRLSFILALVFVLTLAFGVLPGASADPKPKPTEPDNCLNYILKSGNNISSGNFTNGNILVIKQANTVFVWVDPSIAAYTADIATALAEWMVYLPDNSTDNLPFYYTSIVPSFMLKDIIPLDQMPDPAEPYEITISIDTIAKSFSLTRGSVSETISHFYVFNYNCDEPDTGTLTIKKDVTGIITQQMFSIDVTFKNTSGLAGLTPPPGAYPTTIGTSTDTLLTYTLALANSGSTEFTGIPLNTTYSVNEETLSSDWSVSGEVTDVSIDSDLTAEVTITNTYNPGTGSLTITKAIDEESDSGYITPTFKFNVQFGTTITTDFVYPSTSVIDEGNGLFEVSITGPGTVTFSNIPAGTTYTVNEQAIANWTITDTVNSNLDATKAISKDVTDSVALTNKYTHTPYGSLTIDKIVEGTGADGNKPFEITVAFSGADIDGILKDGTTTGQNGTFTFNLSGNGAPVIFSNIPMNTGYTVLETRPTTTGWSYISGEVIDEDNKSINSDFKDVTVEITNRYTPSGNPEFATLTVDKSVTNGSKNQPFTITVVFTGDSVSDITNDKELQGIFSTSVSDPETTATPYPDTLTFTFPLTDNDGVVTFSNIPFLTRYSVNESGSMPANWSNLSGSTGSQPIQLDRENQSDDVVIVNNFTTTPPPPPPTTPTPTPVINTTALTVTKTISGDVGDAPDDTFDFTVTFTPVIDSYSAPVGASGSDGVYTFSLAAGQSIIFADIPVGTGYVVVETSAFENGWEPGLNEGTSSESIGISGATAVFDNIYTTQGVAGASDTEPDTDEGQAIAGDADVLPQTGGISPSTLLGILGLVLIALGGTAVTILRKRNTGKNKNK